MLDVLNSSRRMARVGRKAGEIMAPKIEVTVLGDYMCNVEFKTGSITYEFETKTFNYDRGIKLLTEVMDAEEAYTTCVGSRSQGASKAKRYLVILSASFSHFHRLFFLVMRV